VVGARTKAKIVKNTFAAPFQECEYDLFYGEGISREAELIDLAVARGIIEKSGTWHSYGGERIGQGREASRVALKANPELFNKIYAVVRKSMFDGK
jgi:recombination protein RecA